jgi:hypothetical protein
VIKSLADQLARLRGLPRTIAETITEACVAVWAISQLAGGFDSVCSGKTMQGGRNGLGWERT